MAQLLMGMPRQPFKQSSTYPATGENDPASQLFDQFCSANTFHGIMDTFQQLCDIIGLRPVDHQIFYKQLKTRLLSWKAQSLWTKLDKRAANLEYRKGTACNKTRALVIGSGPCGLRVAIEIALLGGKAVIVEKREGFSRNNVLHLWPFLIHDLKALGAKKFFGKFCAGAIDHISIRALQCILLKVALLVGVEVHSGVAFEGFSEPPPDQTKDKIGWRAKVTPADHPVAEFVFDICISSDGKRNTMTEFKRKEFRGKLAIAITANFINRNTQAEASVEEISGVAYIFNQKFFKDLKSHSGIDLENIVYYKDETHYFVMTAKKQSLLCKGVLMQDYDDPEILLSKENVDQHALLEYARQAADMSTKHRLPNLEFAHNHYGQPDVAMFDFTSMFAAEHACRVVERQGYRLLVGLVGDTLLEPFWPTGSGCARGFLGAFDAAWMIRSWASGKMTPLEVIAERESIYQLLSQTTPENLNKNYLQYTIDPNTRYLNLNVQVYKPHQVSSQYDGHDTEYLSDIVRQAVQQSHRYDSMRDSHNMLKWIQRQLESYQSIVKVVDLSISWHSGMALCALIHHHRPELLDVYSLDPNRVEANNQLAFDVVEKEFGIVPIMTGQEMAQCDAPDKVAMAAYLARICSLLRKETTNLTKTSEDKNEAASKARLISLTKIGSRIRQRREEMERNESSSLKRFQDPINLYDVPSKRVKDLYDANTVLDTYGRIENLEMTYEDLSKYSKLQKELRLLGSGVRGQNKVSGLAKDLASKLSGEGSKPSDESAESSGKAQPSDFCYFCKSRVYTVERYTAEGLLFHRGCFRCDYCGSPLRISYYSYKALGNGEGKFYCVQHHGLQRSAAKSSGQAISALSRDLASTKYAVPPPKVSSITESSYLRCPGKDTATVKRTPERVEYVTESEVEESEYEQTRHNLCSVLRPSAFSDSDSSSSEEELHFSDEDASDEQPDLSWAELARKYNEQQRQTRRTRLPQKRTSSASSGSETETVEGASDADYETDSNTDKENIAEESENGQSLDVGRAFRGERPKGSRDAFSKHLLSLSPKQSIRLETKPSPTSVEIMRNRMAFFSTVSQPVRIDARVFLGLAPPPLGVVIQMEEVLEDGLMDAQLQLEASGQDSSKGKKDDEENTRSKLENGKEERPSKRHAEKKPVVQKAKKRTKRRKKDEKSRVTADVESTRLSTMHEAVPVVSISGATSSDEQDGRLDVENKAAAEITSISKDIVDVKPVGKSDDDNMEDKGSRERPEELGESVEPDVQRNQCSGEEGESSRSKSGGSQASANSQTLQYSDSDEPPSPRGDLLSGEAMLDSKREGVGDAFDSDVVETENGRSVVAVVNGAATEAVASVADFGTAKVSDKKRKASAKVKKPKHAENEFEEVLRIEESDRDDGKFTRGDQKISKVQTAQRKDVHQNVCDGDSGSLQIRHEDDQAMHEDTDEVSDEQKLEHEYVVLEEVMGEGEAGKFSPYEELVTDGSDKEYTKIEIRPSQAETAEADRVLSQGKEGIEDSAGNCEGLVLAASKENGVLVKQECTGSVNDFSVTGAPVDVSRSSLKSDDLFEAEKLCVPRLAPRAESESYSDEDRNTPGRSFDQTNSTGALLLQGNRDILQGLSRDRAEESQPAKVIPERGERTVALEENVNMWSEVVDNLEDVKKKETWPVTSSEVLVETGVRITSCSTLQLERVPEQHIKKVPVAEMGPVWNEVSENLEAVEIRETWPVTTEEMSDETGVHLSACNALNVESTPKGLPSKTQTSSKGEDISGEVITSQEAPAYSKPLEMTCNWEEMRDTIPTQALSVADLQNCPDNGLVSGNLKRSIGEQSLDPLARINLLLESLSVNRDGLSDSGPVSSSGDFIRHQTKQEQRRHGLENEATVTDETKKERPTSLIISEDDQRGGSTSSTDAVARLAQQTKLINAGDRKTEKPSRNDLSSDSSICNASTTSGSVDFMSSLLHESGHAPEQLRSPTDDSISDGRQGTSLAIDDGTSSIDQLASGSLSEDVLSLENVAEVNIEGEDLADLEVEVWPRVILENKCVGDQALSKRLELEAANKESNLLSSATETRSAETSVESAALPSTLLIGQASDHSSVSLASNSSASSVLSPNRIMDAKRRFFHETSQPLRIDPRKVFRDIPSKQQQVLAKEFSGEESSVISGEFDSASSDRRSGVASVLSSGSERGVENVPLTEVSNEIQSSPLPDEKIDKTISEVERKRQLPAVPTIQSSQPSLPVNIGGKGAKQTYLQKAGSSGSDKGRVLISEAEARSKKQIFKERKRPNSAFVVMEDSWRSSKSKGSPVGLSRPMSAKPVPPQPSGQSHGSPVLGAEAGPTRMQASQSDGASTEEASPSLVHKDKESRLKSFYHQKTKGKDSAPTVVKEVHDKKDRKKSLLALLIPSRSLEKKEKATKSPVLQSKTRTPGESSKPSVVSNMDVVREKTKSLPLEKKQAPLPIDSKKAAGDKSLLKGKLKSKPVKVTEEPAETGHSIYKEMAGIMEGIKKVEKRNRDKNSIRDRIEAVAPPPVKAPYTVLLPPKADIEDFETESEFGDDRLSLRSFQSQMHLLSEEEAAKLRKRQQKVARKKQREKELKRLHAAQEVQQQLEEVELRQREIERQGVEIEKALSGEGSEHSRDETNLVQQWFDIVYERNVLMRYESELMVQARELELEDRQSRLEIQLRERIPNAESQRTESLKDEEQRILEELMEVVEQRDALVALLEEDRIRQQQYSKNLERIMVDRGFQLSPISHIHLPQALASLQEDR